jgi:hypothetical protein
MHVSTLDAILGAFASGIELLLGGRVASVRLLQISGFQGLRPGCS